MRSRPGSASGAPSVLDRARAGVFAHHEYSSRNEDEIITNQSSSFSKLRYLPRSHPIPWSSPNARASLVRPCRRLRDSPDADTQHAVPIEGTGGARPGAKNRNERRC